MMCGTPCSGKTTWIEKNTNVIAQKFGAPVVVISRDLIREVVYGSVNHKQTKIKEDIVTEKYYKQFSVVAMMDNITVILDNTHLREKYFKAVFATFQSSIDQKKAEVYIKLCEVPYWKMIFRNWNRRRKTGKFIPVPRLKEQRKQYKELKQILLTKYKENLYNE